MNRRRFLTVVAGSIGVATAGCLSSQNPSNSLPPDHDSTTTTTSDLTTDTTTSPETPEDPITETTTSPETPEDPITEPSTDGIANGSFEDGLNGWVVGTDLPPEPGEESGTVDYRVAVQSEYASDGEAGLACFIDGAADDGTVWVEQAIDFTDSREVQVDVYSEQKSFNILSQVAFFAGEKPDEGLQEKHFDRDEDVQDHEGWKTYRYDVEDRDGEGTVAVGMNIIWETGVTTLFDNIRTVSPDE